ncbi:MAG: hypothetical protein MI919_08635, partial [Holophagales bacterium]|nr:hypothetical protein [Holophagales bacterium]
MSTRRIETTVPQPGPGSEPRDEPVASTVSRVEERTEVRIEARRSSGTEREAEPAARAAVEDEPAYLLLLQEVRSYLERHAAGIATDGSSGDPPASGSSVEPSPATPAHSPAETSSALGPDRAFDPLHGLGDTAPIEIDTAFADTPLGHLRELFGLSPFELRVLVMCAGMELDGSFAALCGMAQSDPTKTYPTFGLALAALHGPDWRALMPESPLRYWQLVTSGGDRALTSAPLTIDERILHFLIGFPCRDPRLAPWAYPLEPPPNLVASERRAADRIAGIFRSSGRSVTAGGATAGDAPAGGTTAGAPPRLEERGRQVPVVQLVGPEIAGKRELAADAGRRLGVEVRRLSAESLPTQPNDLDELARLWRREARLSGAFLLLECDELRSDDVARTAALHQLV